MYYVSIPPFREHSDCYYAFQHESFTANYTITFMYDSIKPCILPYGALLPSLKPELGVPDLSFQLRSKQTGVRIAMPPGNFNTFESYR